ncbi:MAG: hypothetical protein DMD81_02545 [Candidatus Rokuibacteriota bacterium]|nr:MAG: hypothetical protein DMD81_02545 [Candidatus Rokubacteria bacterium]
MARRPNLSHDRRVSDRDDLQARAYDVEDAFAANELFQERGWTDGLPIVPPTESDSGRPRSSASSRSVAVG